MTKSFARFARKAGLGGADLRRAMLDVATGRIDADLGGGVYKQRIARAGGGKSSGFRTIILFKAGARSFFVHGFAKNEKANVSANELQALKRLAAILLTMSVDDVDTALAAGEYIRVDSDDDETREG